MLELPGLPFPSSPQRWSHLSLVTALGSEAASEDTTTPPCLSLHFYSRLLISPTCAPPLLPAPCPPRPLCSDLFKMLTDHVSPLLGIKPKVLCLVFVPLQDSSPSPTHTHRARLRPCAHPEHHSPVISTSLTSPTCRALSPDCLPFCSIFP